MAENRSSRTSVTLIGRLRQDPKDQAAWNDFVSRYEPKILQMKDCPNRNLFERLLNNRLDDTQLGELDRQDPALVV